MDKNPSPLALAVAVLCALSAVQPRSAAAFGFGLGSRNSDKTAEGFLSGHKYFDAKEAKQALADYDKLTAGWLKAPDGREAWVVRAGVETPLDPSRLADAVGKPDPGAVIRLGPGAWSLEGMALAVPVHGSGFGTVVKVRRASVKDLTLANLTLVDSELSPPAPHRVWLENVRILGSFETNTTPAALIPWSSSIVPVLGGFYLKPFRYSSSDPNSKDHSPLFYMMDLFGTVAIGPEALPALASEPGAKDFYKEYLAYLRGGPAPTPASASRFLDSLLKTLRADAIPLRSSYLQGQKEARIQLDKARWARLVDVLRRDFGARSASEDGGAPAELLAKAEAAEAAGRRLTALYHLTRALTAGLSSAEAARAREKTSRLRADLSREYGAAVDFELSAAGVTDSAVNLSQSKTRADYVAQWAGLRGAWLREPLEARFPIVRIADAAQARFRFKVVQRRDDHTAHSTSQGVTERYFQVEDEAAKAEARRRAQAAALANFQAVMKNFDITASAMEKSARTSYEQRTRIEDTASGRQMVWYENRRNAGAPALEAMSASPSAAPGMRTVKETTEHRLYVNERSVTVEASVSERGKVLDALAPISNRETWNYECVSKKAGNGFGGTGPVNSDCFGGSGGHGAGVIRATLERQVLPWVSERFESLLLNEALRRLAKAGASKDRAEVAESILLGRALGVPADPEQDAILRQELGDAKAFEELYTAAAAL